MKTTYPTDPREALLFIARERRETLSALSTMLGRGRAYLQQYVARGIPKQLSSRDGRLLADHFGVDEAVLGGHSARKQGASVVSVPRLAVQASAGPGTEVDGEFQIGAYRFDAEWLRSLGATSPEALSIIRVSGDSMTPLLADGDDLLVDRSAPLRDGIYVLRRDDTLMVKRLALAPTSGTLTISSDNPVYPTWRDVTANSIQIIGRVIWSSRKVA